MRIRDVDGIGDLVDIGDESEGVEVSLSDDEMNKLEAGSKIQSELADVRSHHPSPTRQYKRIDDFEFGYTWRKKEAER